MDACYFVTGATGVVGSAVVERLLADTPGPIHILVRAADERILSERARALREHLKVRGDAERRLFFHRGDVGSEGLGLSVASRRGLIREVTHVIHAAGDVHMRRSLDAARAIAVGGTQRVLALAEDLHRARRLQKVEYVSTVGVGGRAPGALSESFVSAPTAFHNTYEQSKWEAETVVERHVRRGLPVTVHRPSMVVGDSRTGRSIRSQLFATICAFLTGGPTLGLLPSLSHQHIDLVPQDFVARALVWSSRTRATSGRVLHLCSGRYEATRLVDLARAARTDARRNRQRTYRPIFVGERSMRAAVRAMAWAPPTARRKVALLTLLLDYLKAPKVFDNEATLRVLRAGGVLLPASQSYLGRVVGAALADRMAS